ncbi:MAG: TIGR03067 domain-containing protein [Pirellulaceae bacterium]|nr:TIGR03067 domain-containing protein [Planctomycetales bacterium]
MKQMPILLVVFLLVSDCWSAEPVGVLASTDIEEAKSGDFQFDGVWKPKGAMLQGVLLPPPALDAITLRIEGDTYEVTVEGEEHSDKGVFLLDETVMPKRMVIKSTSGPNKGKIILAIYEVKSDIAMRVCYDLTGKAFPTDFKAPKNSDLYVAGYRRQQADNSAE